MRGSSPDAIGDTIVVAKAGIWYTICNFCVKGMAFLTTPIFARLLSKEEMGSFTNFTSWISILLVLTSFDLSQSIIRSKLEHKDDIDSYIWSILSFSTITTLIAYSVVCLFSDFFVGLFKIEMQYIHVMFMYLMVFPAYQMLITKHRTFYRYKSFVVLTSIIVISSILISLIMVFLMENKLTGRIMGHYLPYILFGAGIYIMLACRGKKVKTRYWKYACMICLPLVPHVLSMYVLNASDKIMLTAFQGEEFTAIYGIAYTCYYIVSTLFDSMNKAWAPWLLDSLHQNRYTEIRRVSKIYIAIFALLSFGVLLIVPELIFILGGNQYAAAVYCLPPLIAGCMFQLVYTMYVNIEFYKKKTFAVAGATIVAMLLNVLLNLYFLPRYRENCFVIASYTTLIGFIVLFLMHYFLVRRMGLSHVYDTKFILLVLVLTLVITTVVIPLYSYHILRYCILLIYVSLLLFYGLKNKDKVLGIFRNPKNV